MIRYSKTLIIICLIAILTYSCSNSKKDKVNTSKNELILAFSDEPEAGFDPTQGWGEYGSPLFQSTLLKYDKDFNIEKDLATDYSLSEDGLTWTVNLRNDVRFTNGDTLTAKDVVFTFEKAKSSKTSIDLTNLDKVEANEKYQVQFKLKERNSSFLTYLITLGIVPSKVYDKNYSENPIGSGIYKLAKWDKGQQIIIIRNEDYYGKKPFFKKLTFVFLAEDAAFAAAKSGQVDMAAISPSLSGQKVKDMKLVNLKTVDNRGISMPMTPNNGKTTDKGAPIGNDVTSDIAIRKALNIGINRKELIKNVLNGYGSPAYTIADHLPWWNEATVIEDNDLEGAKALLDKAGWKENERGIREKDGIEARFTVFYPSNDGTRQTLALAFAQMAKPLGIKVDTKGENWKNIEKNMHSNPVVFGLGNHTPLVLYNSFSSSSKGQGLNNPIFYSNPQVDKYFNKALSAKTQKEANAYWKKAQWDGKTGFTFKGDAAWIWLANLDHLFLVNENLEIGPQKLQPHEHNWPITDFVDQWHWKK